MSSSLTSFMFDTPLGTMLAVADCHALYVLEFVESDCYQATIERLQKKFKTLIIAGQNELISSIMHELQLYFSGQLQTFKTPLFYIGTAFQQKVWQALQDIPYGETRSYADVAASIGKPRAFRAVARANATNLMAIIIPCHRVINHDGKLGGYGGGLERKKWMLTLEQGAAS